MMAEDLQTRTDVSIFAKSGLETGEILGLMSFPYIQRRIQAADMITITGCGNDLIDSVQAYQQTSDASVFTSVSSHCHENFEKMITKIAALKGRTRLLMRSASSIYTILSRASPLQKNGYPLIMRTSAHSHRRRTSKLPTSTALSKEK